MPTYRYRCGECGDEFEAWQSFQDEPLTSHDACGGPVVKVLTPAGIVLKGPGFYKTDNRAGAKSGGGERSSDKKPEPKKDGDSSSGSTSKESGGSSSSTPASTPASTKTT